MKQLVLSGITPFAPEPITAPDSVVTACPSEAEAVRWCLDYARIQHGLSLRTVAKLCGWKGASYLSEIASESSEKTMPETKVGLFTLATGNRLLEQYLERQETLRRLKGQHTVSDRSRMAVAAMLAIAA